MSIIATNNSTPRELIPAGNYVARCYQMIQIGTVTEMINGENKILQKVRIGWEFPNDTKVFNEEKGEQPIVVSEEYTLSMGDKANLRKMLESWRGKGFSADEAKAFDITALIGKPCMVNIIHVTSKKDATRVYLKIGSVSSMPKGMLAPPAVNKPFVLSYDEFSMEKFNSLPDFIKDKMKTSVEFTALNTPSVNQTAGQQTGVNGNVLTPEPIDDLPF